MSVRVPVPAQTPVEGAPLLLVLVEVVPLLLVAVAVPLEVPVVVPVVLPVVVPVVVPVVDPVVVPVVLPLEEVVEPVPFEPVPLELVVPDPPSVLMPIAVDDEPEHAAVAAAPRRRPQLAIVEVK
jgi:hypothetical protein